MEEKHMRGTIGVVVVGLALTSMAADAQASPIRRGPDRIEDRIDRREDRRDRREDRRDARHVGGLRDRLEDVRDRREDIRDRLEDRRDRRR
jgi:hypothetical protein